ncbi:MAG: hypothetical protein QOH25_829 [Acidobacteriota bacterium]|jgi:hypothetical protein|nr:hypothetical protein [Acidobacteriota bacterium]
MYAKDSPGTFTKLAWSLPWLLRYPFWRASELVRRMTDGSAPQRLIFVIANHFEPGWSADGTILDLSTQQRRLEDWCAQARAIGEAVRDHDGTSFRHTNFYPAEQYHRPLLERMAELQAEGLGEVEIHLHHGVDQPDTAENTKRTLIEFRDALAEEHKCLSRMEADESPRYAFVHGNWALANSARGRCCGVDSEMQILAETGCYADLTLPSAPDISQVARINAIYQCGHPLTEQKPHRSGPSARVGDKAKLPLIFTGPLAFDWERRFHGLPVPRIDNGALTAIYPPTSSRLNRWRGTHIGITGRPDWVFVKLYCHGFFDEDQPAMIGDVMQRFLLEALELSERTGQFKLHFASAREMFNIAMAAIDGREGDPGLYRDYRLRQIMQAAKPEQAEKGTDAVVHQLS